MPKQRWKRMGRPPIVRETERRKLMTQVRGWFHQGDKQFLADSAGYQSCCNSLIMLAHLTDVEVSNITAEDINTVLVDGNHLHRSISKTLQKTTNQVTTYLTVPQLPTSFSISSSSFSVEYFEKIKSNYKYGELYWAFRKALMVSRTILLVMGHSVLAVFRDKVKNKLVLFDPHARNEGGMFDSNGVAIVLYFGSIPCLTKFVKKLANNIKSTEVELHPIKLCCRKVYTLCSAETTTAAHVGQFSSRVQSVIQGSFHQTDSRFSPHSAGRQGSCNSLVMLAYLQQYSVLTSDHVDEVLLHGDRLYHIISENTDQGSDRYSCHMPLTTSQMPSVLVLKDFKYQIKYFPSIYGTLLYDSRSLLETFEDVLKRVLSMSKAVIFVMGHCNLAIFEEDGKLGVFDPQCRNRYGLPDVRGAATVLYFSSIRRLICFVNTLARSLALSLSDIFEVRPLTMRPLLPSYVLRSSMHQGDSRHFSPQSAGRQNCCNSLMMLGYAEGYDEITPYLLDEVLRRGDELCLSILASLHESLGPKDLSISDMPSSLSVDNFEFQVKFLHRFKRVLFRTVSTAHGLGKIPRSFVLALQPSSKVILVMDRYMFAVFETKTQEYALFDPRSRNEFGLADSNGSANVLYFPSVEVLAKFFLMLAEDLEIDKSTVIELHPVRLKRVVRPLNAQVTVKLEEDTSEYDIWLPT